MTAHKKRISVYLPDPLYQALIAYQEQQALNSVPAAAIEILNQFFEKGDETKSYATVEQLEALEGKLLA